MTHPFDSPDDVRRAEFRERRPVKKRRGRKILIAVAVVVALIAVVAGGYLFNLARTFDSGSSKIEQAFPDESTRPKKTDNSINILVMGSDSRGSAESDAAGGTPTEQRADTLMLMHIPADRKNIYTMSIMRDLWVDIPDQGEAKINSALALGGTPLMVQTVESIFQQRIDHMAMIDFEGFKGLTDALGGVTVNLDLPFTSTALKGQSFAPGQHTFNGTEALAFVRERHAYADGDYQRVRNQQEFLRAIIKKSTAGQTLEQPDHHHQHGGVRLAVRHGGQVPGFGRTGGAGARAEGHPAAEHGHVHTAHRRRRNFRGRPVDRAGRPRRYPGHLRGDGLRRHGRVRGGQQGRERQLIPAG